MRWLGLGIAVAVGMAGCTPASTRPAPSLQASSNRLVPAWAATSLDLDAVRFHCARAADGPVALRALAGPGLTHAQALAQCRRELERAAADLRAYDLALIRARDVPAMTRERLHAFAGRLQALMDDAVVAAQEDDATALSFCRFAIADVEGRMLAAGA